jgi:colicin import membrane protein
MSQLTGNELVKELEIKISTAARILIANQQKTRVREKEHQERCARLEEELAGHIAQSTKNDAVGSVAAPAADPATPVQMAEQELDAARNAQKESELHDLRQAHDRGLDALRAEKLATEAALADVQREHEVAMTSLAAEMTAKEAHNLAALKQQLTQVSEEKGAQLKQQHAKAVATKDAASSEALLKQQMAHRKALAEKDEQIAEQVKMIESHSAAVGDGGARTRQLHAQQLVAQAAQAAESEAAAAAQLEQQQRTHAQQLAAASAAAAQAAESEAATAAQLEQQQQAHAKELASQAARAVKIEAAAAAQLEQQQPEASAKERRTGRGGGSSDGHGVGLVQKLKAENAQLTSKLRAASQLAAGLRRDAEAEAKARAAAERQEKTAVLREQEKAAREQRVREQKEQKERKEQEKAKAKEEQKEQQEQKARALSAAAPSAATAAARRGMRAPPPPPASNTNADEAGEAAAPAEGLSGRIKIVGELKHENVTLKSENAKLRAQMKKFQQAAAAAGDSADSRAGGGKENTHNANARRSETVK